jgi:uncharacterized protein YyaL (SSP411 family)
MIRRLVAILLILVPLPLAAKNRLAAEKSAYLRGHGDNPVDWSPWGPDAFARAKAQQKPIFLSIGYASCHWCHVMERESFENAEIAKLLNDYFVPVLVDREEHADVDASYLAFVQATTGSGGWPANLILAPDLQPLIGTTYMKPDALSRLLVLVSNRWANERPAFLASAQQAMTIVRAEAEQPAAAEVAAAQAVKETVARIRETYDEKNGGFGSSPKFPQASTLDFLLRSGDEHEREIAIKTLKAMAAGSIYDQLGGGFHRYTTDAAWREPHFEKMLYDQALLANDYLEAWQLTRDPELERVARATLDYIARDLRMPNGGFASGEDADSLIPGKTGPELVEGAFYRWNPGDYRFLGKRNEDIATYVYGIDKPASLPYIAHSPAMARIKFGGTEQEIADALEAIRSRMFEVRSKRPQAFRDDKVIAGWNGLAIGALARGGAAFGEPRYVKVAAEAQKLIRTKLWSQKMLLRRYAGGQAAIDALPEDYAFVIEGTLDLFEANGDAALLEFAVELQTKQDELFWSGSRYEGGGTVPRSLAGIAAESDANLPAANSVSASNLLRLAEFTDAETWRMRAAAIFKAYGSRLPDLPRLASALAMTLAAPRQIVIAGEANREDTRELLRIAHQRLIPFRVIVPAIGEAARARIAVYMPVVREMKPREHKAVAFVCEHHVCKLPTSDPIELAKSLETP